MQKPFLIFRRGRMFYCEDRSIGRQTSLHTRQENEAWKLVQAKNEAAQQPLMNLAMAKTYLAAHDPRLLTRTWADVMERFRHRDTGTKCRPNCDTSGPCEPRRCNI